MRRLHLAANIVLAVSGFAIFHVQSSERATSICSILADPGKYDGKLLLIRGQYRWQPHGPIFYGANCSRTEVRLDGWTHERDDRDAKAIWESLVSNDDTQPIKVVYRAKFSVVHGFDCTAVSCFRYKLEHPELVSARP